jgi:hypothetical protein
MHPMTISSLAKRRWLLLAALFALYFAITCLITWPLISQLGIILVGRTTDSMVHYWNGYWFQQALQLGQSPFHTPLLNYPEGVSLVTHNFALLNILPWLLLEPIIGGITAYNLIILLSLALCGFAMYLLADELLHHPQASFIAGLIYMAWPYRLSQLDHPNLLATFWVPIFFLFLIRTLRESRWLDALFAGLALALVGYTRWQLLIPVSFMTLVYLLATFKHWFASWKQTLPLLALAAAVAIIALLPPAMMLLREQVNSNLSASVIYEQDEQSMSTDLLAYLTPSKRHFTLKSLTKPLVDHYYPDRTPGRRYPTYIGLSVLLLAVIGLIKRWRDTWVWLLMALVLIGLAAGMVLRVNGQLVTAVPTLYKLLAPLQVARLIRIPERYVIFLALPLSLLAAYGWHCLITSRRLSRWRLLLTLLLSIIILYEYQSMPLQSQYIDYDKTVFKQLAQEPGEFAILNLPLRYRFSKEYLYEQTYHERPILQGHVSREPENLYRFIEQSEWMSGLPDLEVDPGYLMAQLSSNQVGYVVLSKYLLEEPTWRLWKRHMPYAPFFNYDRYLVYATVPEYGRDLDQPHELLTGLGTVEHTLSSYCSTEQIIPVAAVTWASTTPLPEDYAIRLTATSEKTGAQLHGPVTPLADTWPTTQWPAGTVTRQAYSMPLPPDTSPYTLMLQVIDPQEGMLQGDPSLGFRHFVSLGQIDSAYCTIEAGSAASAGVIFGDNLQLLSYDVAQEVDDLVITLHWLAEERPSAAYKFFLHLYDPQTKDIVAQIDTMPLDWRLPTTDWKSGELVADQIRLSLADVPPGQYELAVGVYNAETGLRLPLSNITNSLKISDDGRLLLPDTIQIPQE